MRLLRVLMVTNALLPLLRRSPSARIVNVSSGVGSLAHHTDPEHYMSGLPAAATDPVSKTALNQLTVQYAKELSKDGILVKADGRLLRRRGDDALVSQYLGPT
ncbi:hypothetical protein [Nonomuraea sp. 10N515B]|uniref:hypothetical protein n=1 Tax=Nonomuraea sp. 10N515B TaxID=3457422 RepID=UPI003FCDA712